MKSTFESRLGLFVAVSLASLLLLIELAGGLTLFRRDIELGARFENVQELKVGAQIRMAGVTIGRVSDIDFDGNMVKVAMSIESEKAKNIKTDSIATIQFMGLMGQNYISIEFGQTGVVVQPGAVLATREQPNINFLIDRLSGVASGVEQITQTFSDDKFSDILAPLADFLMTNKEKVSEIIDNVQSSVAHVAQGKGTVGRLIHEDVLHDDALSMVNDIKGNSKTLDAILGDAQSLVADIRGGKGTIGKLATDEELFTDTREAIAFLRDILEKIDSGDGSVGVLVNDPSLIHNAKAALQKVEKATEGLEDQGPLSVLGLAIGRLF